MVLEVDAADADRQLDNVGAPLLKAAGSGQVDRGFARLLGVAGEEQIADRFGSVVVEFGDVGGVGVEG